VEAGVMTDKTAETWLYMGVRVNRKGSQVTTWLDPAGTEIYCAGPRVQVPSGVIGGRYTATVVREGDEVERSWATGGAR